MDQAEAVSELYAKAFDVERDGMFYFGKLTEELGEVSAAYLKTAGRARGADGDADGDAEAMKADRETELAELFGFLMLFARYQGVDLGAAFDKKWGAYLTPDAERST